MKLPSETFVLYVEHDNRPHDVQIFLTANDARQAARNFARDIWAKFGDDNSKHIPSGNTLLDFLSTCNEHVRLYRCTADGSEEVGVLR